MIIWNFFVDDHPAQNIQMYESKKKKSELWEELFELEKEDSFWNTGQQIYQNPLIVKKNNDF